MILKNLMNDTDLTKTKDYDIIISEVIHND